MNISKNPKVFTFKLMADVATIVLDAVSVFAIWKHNINREFIDVHVYNLASKLYFVY